jgi:hypothetical protein
MRHRIHRASSAVQPHAETLHTCAMLHSRLVAEREADTL